MFIPETTKDGIILAECLIRFVALAGMYHNDSLVIAIEQIKNAKRDLGEEEDVFMDAAIKLLESNKR